ncbi:MAG: hypothetical protein U0W40_20915, partial [Acidimicrobiia bacterium]
MENAQWVDAYGSPCRECGFDFAQEPESAVATVETLPAQFATALRDDASAVPPGCTWSVTAYTFHVADNLRIFAERLEGVRAGGPTSLVGYDENELAAARHYDEMSAESAEWSLANAVPLWAAASRAALTAGTTFTHSEYGELSAREIVRAPAHDAVHHAWDVS